MKKINLKDFVNLNKGDMLYLVNKKVKRHKWIIEFLKFKENKLMPVQTIVILISNS